MRYTLAYLVFCGATIALLVFLNSTQPFVLSQVFGYEQNGSTSGVLALVDEVVSLVLAPFWGALSDKIGTRYCAVAGLLIMAAALAAYPRAASVYPGLLLLRGLFSVGASACVAMVTAGLGELSLLASGAGVGNASGRTSFSVHGDETYDDDENDSAAAANASASAAATAATAAVAANRAASAAGTSRSDEEDGDRTVPLFEAPAADAVFDAVLATPRPNGKLAGFAGFASGMGAVLAVSVLLPLPTALADGAAGGLRSAYAVVAAGTAALALALLLTMYQNPARGLRSFVLGSEHVSIFDEAAVDAGGSVMSYMELLADGFGAARADRRLQVAYFGSLVARSASVVLALFVPLWVNQWFYRHGRCVIDDPAGCRAAITQAAILTGIANTVMLLVAPIIGWAGDRFGSVRVLAGSAAVGLVAMLGLLLDDAVSGALPVAVCCLAGAAQIGVITMSMSMSTDKRRAAGGSVAGVYSLCGSVGILLVTQIGGPLADVWIKAPFVVMAVLFALLVVVAQTLAARTVLRSSRSAFSLH